MLRTCLLLALIFQTLISAQQVDRRHLHERIWAVVPMIGTGTAQDPRRPAYAPTRPTPGAVPNFDGIIAYSMQASDDGRYALVEFVGRSQEAFKEILAGRRPEVKVFVKGKATWAEVEAAFRIYKRDFDLDKLGAL